MDEQKKFLETAETEYGWYYPMLKVMLLTGMRISEVGGLCWSDIDYDNDVIHIRRALFSQYEYGKKKLHFTTTKTINSERDIPMMEDCKKMLKLQKKNQNKIKKELGKRYRSENEEGLSDLVFTSSMGSAATRYNVAPIINKIVKSINLREDYESVKENRKPIYMEQVSPHALRSLPVSLVRRKCNTIIRADMSFHFKKCIRRKKEFMKKDDCIFCKLANGDIPTNSIYEDEVVKVIFDASPAAPGHILILPKNHYDDIYSMDDETAAHVFKVAVKLSKAYRKALDFDGLNIVQNNGEAAGQTVFHFHMHIIPRYKNDTVNVTWKQNEADASVIEDIKSKVSEYLKD